MFEILDITPDIINIKIIGICGCGLNAMQHLFLSSPTWDWNAEFIYIDTDVLAIQKLEKLHTATTIQLEPVPITDMNANGNTIMNYQFNMQDRERIESSIASTTWLFIIAGMGGNTGTIIAPAVAQLAQEMGIFTVAIISRPFLTNTSQRINFAKAGLISS